jgi:hypothetical protein
MNFMICGKIADIKALLEELEDAGVEDTALVETGMNFHGRTPITVDYAEFGYFNSQTFEVTAFSSEENAETT